MCPGVLDKAAKKALREEKKTMTKSGMASETDLSMGLTRTNTTTSVSSSLALGKGKMVRSLSTGGASALSSSSGTPVAKAPSPLSIAELPTDSRPARRILAPPPERYVPPPTIVSSSDEDDTPPSTPIPAASVSDSNLRGKLIYTFSASGENEVTADEGSIVTILEDDGAWMTVQLSNGEEGLVPSSYVEKMAPVEKKKGRGPPPPVKPRGASKSVNLHKVKALYAYNAQGDDEVTMDAGEEMVVLERDVGGWVKVRRGSLEGLVPGTYVADC